VDPAFLKARETSHLLCPTLLLHFKLILISKSSLTMPLPHRDISCQLDIRTSWPAPAMLRTRPSLLYQAMILRCALPSVPRQKAASRSTFVCCSNKDVERFVNLV
jgi:hypothetical protein